MKTGLFSIQLIGASLALLFASACVPTDDGSGDGDPSETGDGDGDQTEQGGDGDGDPTTGDGDGDPTTGDGDGDPTTGDGDGDGDPIAEACAAACGVFESCEEVEPGCVEECVIYHQDFGDDAECLEFALSLTECISGLSCEELTQFLDETPMPYPCQAESEATCSSPGDVCLITVGDGQIDGECSVIETCEGLPERSVECDGQICTCFVDAVEVGGCSDALAVCGDPGSAAIDACCG